MRCGTLIEQWQIGWDARGRAITLVRRPGLSGTPEYAIFQEDETDLAGGAELYGLTAELLVRLGVVGGSSSD